MKLFIVHRQRNPAVNEGSHHTKAEETSLMKALPIKATLTVEGMINDLGNEVKKEKISTGLFKRSLIFLYPTWKGRI